MNTKTSRYISHPLQAGFTLLELMLVCAILATVLAAVFQGISTVIQRSQSEQVKVDLTQSAREFVDEFERDLHQAGFPNCRMVSTVVSGVSVGCPADYSTATQQAVAFNSQVAVGLVHVDSTKIIFEGAMDGSGTIYSVQYQLVDANGVNPPVSCPCTLQRSEVAKPNNTDPELIVPTFSQELQNVVNSGRPVGNAAYGGGAPITGNTAWGASNTAYYAALTTFKDYPVFQAYDQYGNIVSLPVDLATAGATQTLTCAIQSVTCIKSIRLTLNLLANATTGVDMKDRTRPITTLVGNARLVNN
jgi:prepilin-type N-terminal cleavage/methylation domain-containing protein